MNKPKPYIYVEHTRDDTNIHVGRVVLPLGYLFLLAFLMLAPLCLIAGGLAVATGVWAWWNIIFWYGGVVAGVLFLGVIISGFSLAFSGIARANRKDY